MTGVLDHHSQKLDERSIVIGNENAHAEMKAIFTPSTEQCMEQMSTLLQGIRFCARRTVEG
jgi:hypothetical protein